MRVIARLDIKAPLLVKGIQMEGFRVLGDPVEFARRYYEEGVDELLYVDIVASLYQRNTFLELLEKIAKNSLIPLTAAGGIRSLEITSAVLNAGADKVAINTAAVRRPKFLKECVEKFGSQSIVLSVEAKRKKAFHWEVMIDNGREPTGREVLDWIEEGQELGVGEILLTSIDQDGTRRGFDLELIQTVSQKVKIPLIVGGGMGNFAHLSALSSFQVEGVAVGTALHYGSVTVPDIRRVVMASQPELPPKTNRAARPSQLSALLTSL